VSAIRIVPEDDDAEFPYAEARRRLEIDAELMPKDFAPMIEAGKRMGWSPAMVRANEELAERGKSFDFIMKVEPFLQGTLYEDNIYFIVDDDEKAAKKYIRALARELGAAVYTH
jgi:hypothetical protein